MRSAVMIKGNKLGFQIALNPTLTFEELLQEVATKFKESANFFDPNRPVAIGFEGRPLSSKEQDQIVDVILENSNLNISYIINGSKAAEARFERAINKVREESGSTIAESKEEAPKPAPTPQVEEIPFQSEQKTEKQGQFYRGTLRSGQSIEVDGSIVILGDINPGANVLAGGNVVVLGCLKGTVTAGYPDDKSAVVAALMMDPMQIRIGDLIAKSPDQKNVKKKKTRKKQAELEAKLAFVENDNIFIETITRSLISEFSSK